MTRILVIVCVLLASAAAALVWLGVRSLDAPLQLAAPLRFKVSPGASFARVAAELASQGVIAQPRAWVLYARWSGLAPAVKAGEYEIQPRTTPRQLLAKMVSGQVMLHSFTIVDGWRVQDMLSALRRNPDVIMTLPDQAPDLAAKLGLAGSDAEGQFLPETYRFTAGTTDLELLRQAHAALVQELDAAWMNRDAELPLQNAHELLIMASIIQKESGLPQELGKIAGLYLHRFAIHMPLQADPTVIYGLGDRYDGRIHTVDLRTDGPFNTYTRTGLPPTPIALAGSAAIRAAAHPEKTDAIYFVASTKDDGSHVFSSTLEQHNAAVARYVEHQRRKSAGEGAR
ncbi:MAG: endolytic transglycosylase MltG [Pseudomonadota bacterium]|nr:endolytic transglycosylase MltG [Pseudomonadota bacterium]